MKRFRVVRKKLGHQMLHWTIALFLLTVSLIGCEKNQETRQLELVWEDEFMGTQLDTTKWSFQLGDGCPALCGWGNNELQWYQKENVSLQDGLLSITAKADTVENKHYTSARIRSIGKGDWTYGRFEIRAKMPIGQGMWPAIWMLPTDSTIYGVWAASGEIDIMEYVGHLPNEIFGTIHYGGTWPRNTYTSKKYMISDSTFHDSFHVFSIEWEPDEIRWYVDETLYAKQTKWYSENGDFPAPFDQDFHMILNLAVGGNLPGNPDETTSFPQTMLVDYVRVFKFSI